NGSYTSTLTATTPGTATVTAAVTPTLDPDGAPVTPDPVTLTITPGAPNPTTSTLTTVRTTQTTDDAATLSLQLVDAHGNPTTLDAVPLQPTTLDLTTTHGTLTPPRRRADGTYVSTLAATRPGTATVTATLDGRALPTVPTISVRAAPGGVRWSRSFGVALDSVRDLAADGDGHIYVTGSTAAALAGANAGKKDAYLRKYTLDGTLVWTRQFGSSKDDGANAVAIDAQGRPYVAGFSNGPIPGAEGASGTDAFVRAYAADGTVRWTTQFADVRISDVAVDADGYAYVGGRVEPKRFTYDAHVRAYDPDGTIRWKKTFGDADNSTSANGVATDAEGYVYVSGNTETTLVEGETLVGNDDAFVRSYVSNGDVRWTEQFGTPAFDEATDVATGEDGHVYVTGRTRGSLLSPSDVHAGGLDVFVRSFVSNGDVRWTDQFGTSADDEGTDVTVGADGLVALTGKTEGDLERTLVGTEDGFLRTYDTEGARRGALQYGGSADQYAFGVALDAKGNAYVAWSGEQAPTVNGIRRFRP
ncbi:MAG: SBBP repeat-containing protein, partial [Trueperaceae bacterium]|nr:SBBP repeat-containing protein [Trueperaceae bacterium]